jgi:hypothetical protein
MASGSEPSRKVGTMNRRTLALVLLPALFFSSGAYLQETSPSEHLAAGIRQFDEGDLEAAVITLDTAIQRFKSDGGRKKDLAQAHFYLAMAKLGLSQPDAAKRAMSDALQSDPNLELNPKLYPPRVIQLYEEARKETGGVIRPSPSTPSAAPTVTGQTSKKGGGGKAILIVGAGAAVAGVAIAVGAGGSGGTGQVPTTMSGSLTVTLNVGPEGLQRCNSGISIFATATNTTATPITINAATMERQVVASNICEFGRAARSQVVTNELATRTVPAGARDVIVFNSGLEGSCMVSLCTAQCRGQIDIVLETSFGAVRASDTYDVGYPGTPPCYSECFDARQMSCGISSPSR